MHDCNSATFVSATFARSRIFALSNSRSSNRLSRVFVAFSRSATRFSRKARSRCFAESFSRAFSLFRSSRLRNKISSLSSLVLQFSVSFVEDEALVGFLSIVRALAFLFVSLSASRNYAIIISLLFSSASYSVSTSTLSASIPFRPRLRRSLSLL